MELPLLNDILIIFGMAIAVLLACHRFNIPVIVGLLITGVIAGPYGLKLVSAVHEVELLAEIGVVLLLFTIGIDFSLNNLLKIKKAIFLGGGAQVVLTCLCVFGLARALGQNFGEAVFAGFLVSLSSTAIVLNLLKEKAQVDSLHGRTGLGILIFQDLIIVPMILITPMLAGQGGGLAEFGIFLIKGIGLIALVLIGARWAIPRLLFLIARTRSRELFLLSIAAICLGIAWLTSMTGLSLALGAFLAGLIISESEYAHNALGNIMPFRDVFASLFFVSIGMLLDLGFFLKHPGIILLLTIAIVFIKALIALIAAMALGLSVRTAILVGFSLCQIGEFSFILSKTGLQFGLLSAGYQYFLASAVLTMAATPFIINFAPRLAERAAALPLPGRLLKDPLSSLPNRSPIKDHLVIVGFGLNGRNVARGAKMATIPYVAIETAPETVRSERDKGEPIFYGDATHEAVLEHANIQSARVAVVAISDPTAIRRIAANINRLNPAIHLIVRTQYVQEMQSLYELGANEVIPEEFETSVEIFARVLNRYLVPRQRINQLVSQIRADGYQMLRCLSGDEANSHTLQMYLPDVEITSFQVSPSSQVVGKSLADIGLRKRYGITVLAIRRATQIISDNIVDIPFAPDDLLYAMGSTTQILDGATLFEPS